MTAEPAGQLAGALTLTGQLVTAARDGQWADPAPGPGWNVRDLASHIAGKPAVRRHLAGPARTTRQRPGPSPPLAPAFLVLTATLPGRVHAGCPYRRDAIRLRALLSDGCLQPRAPFEPRENEMTSSKDSRAVAVAVAHVEAWSNHDFDTARNGLAADVRVTAATTNPAIPATDLTGADDYMKGLVAFAQGVVPGSQRVLGSVGDERNALVMLTVQVTGPDGVEMTAPGARLYLLDENGKIKLEHVIFYVAPN